MKNIHKIKENIYITSNEEIKEGDSYIRIDTGLFFKSLKGSNPNIIKKYCKKIILTTDPQLIADGIQAIDDEFLEWFVKNPSCEEVEVNKLCYGALSGYADAGYKIITPKEQQKQHLIDMMKSDEELGLYEENQQGVLLERATFEFSQDGNCISGTDDYEFLTIECESSLGIDRDKGCFYVLKTEKWSIDDENDLKKIFDRINTIVKNNQEKTNKK